MIKFDKYLFAGEPVGFIEKTERLLYEIENCESLPDDFAFFLHNQSMPPQQIKDTTKSLDSAIFYERCEKIKKLSEFWIRCILFANEIVESDGIIKLAKDPKTTFDDLVNTISQIGVLKADENLFPFLTNLKNNCYSENSTSQLLEDFSSFLTGVSDAMPHC